MPALAGAQRLVVEYPPMATHEELNKTGMEHYRAGRYLEAIEAYESAISQRPDFAPCHLNLSLAYLKKGRIDDAIHSAERVVELAPQAGQARYNLANALSAKGRWNEAATEYLRTFEIDRTLAVSLLLAANLLFDHGVNVKAIELWKRFLSAVPPDHPRRKEAEEQLRLAEGREQPFSKF
jgi:tetratricopeptide (TPR) repeat protein